MAVVYSAKALTGYGPQRRLGPIGRAQPESPRSSYPHRFETAGNIPLAVIGSTSAESQDKKAREKQRRLHAVWAEQCNEHPIVGHPYCCPAWERNLRALLFTVKARTLVQLERKPRGVL